MQSCIRDIPDSGEPGLAVASGKPESRPSKDPYGLLSSSFHISAADFRVPSSDGTGRSFKKVVMCCLTNKND